MTFLTSSWHFFVNGKFIPSFSRDNDMYPFSIRSRTPHSSKYHRNFIMRNRKTMSSLKFRFFATSWFCVAQHETWTGNSELSYGADYTIMHAYRSIEGETITWMRTMRPTLASVALIKQHVTSWNEGDPEKLRSQISVFIKYQLEWRTISWYLWCYRLSIKVTTVTIHPRPFFSICTRCNSFYNFTILFTISINIIYVHSWNAFSYRCNEISILRFKEFRFIFG